MTFLDNVIIVAFMAFTIIIGVIAGRSIKTTTEFAVGNKDFMTMTLVMTVFATWMDGEVILNISTQGFKSGMLFLIAACSGSAAMFFSGCIAPRVNKFRNAISAGDIVGSMYGKGSQAFTGIAGFLSCTAFVATQFKALSFVYSYFYGIDSDLGVWLSALSLIAYSAFGGVKAVTWTDVIQFFILINAVPLVTSVALNEAGGLIHLFKTIDASKVTFDISDKALFYSYIVYFISVAIPSGIPPITQRMLMSNNPLQARNAYWIAALISIPFFVIIIISGITAYHLNPNLDPNNVFLYLVDQYMPTGFKGFAVAGIIAVIMSSADSFMNTAAISFSHDFLKTVRGPKLIERNELRITKFSTIIIGILACIMAINFDTILELMLYSFTLWGPVVSVPLIFGVFGYILPRYGFYICMTAGVGTAILWEILDLEKYYYFGALVPALLANLTAFIICYNTSKNIKEPQTL